METFQEMSWVTFILVGISAYLFYHLCLSIYRITLHPLAGFPGPKLAAITSWYEFYYDIPKRGQYVFKIQDMHKKYGGIVRISPWEIHIETPEFYETLYSRSEKRNIWGPSRKGFGLDVSTVVTEDHDLHRKRRQAMIPMFSKQRVTKLQPRIQERVYALLRRVEMFRQSGEILNFKLGYAAFTADVAMDYFFGKCQNKIEVSDFDYEFHNAIEGGFHKLPLNFHFPWIVGIMTTVAHYTPAWIVTKFISSSGMSSFIAAQRQIHIQTREALARPAPEKEDSGSYTLFDQILQSRLPPQEKVFRRLVQEGGLMVSAATVSTAWALTTATFCLLSHPSALAKVKAELALTFPEKPTWDSDYDLVKLDHLPYLQAVIQESIRIGIGPSRRSQRISPENAITYIDPDREKTWSIPAGTPVSMSQPLLLRHERIFPDPYEFKPERWIENPGLSHFQVAFSKGSRICPGINLATTEMNLMLASLFARYGTRQVEGPWDEGVLELYDTDRTDIECVGDGGVALVREGSQGVRVKVIPKSAKSS